MGLDFILFKVCRYSLLAGFLFGVPHLVWLVFQDGVIDAVDVSTVLFGCAGLTLTAGLFLK